MLYNLILSLLIYSKQQISTQKTKQKTHIPSPLIQPFVRKIIIFNPFHYQQYSIIQFIFYMETPSQSQNTSSVSDSHQFTLVSIRVPQYQQPPPPKTCRICMEQTDRGFVSPCKCSGSMKWVHSKCLKTWLTKTATTMTFKKFKNVCCEVCQIKYPFDYQKDKELDCSNIKKNYQHSKTQYIQFSVAGIILLVLIITGCIFLGLMNSNQSGKQLREKIPSFQSVKIALIAILLVLICIVVSVAIIFVVEFGTRTVVTITRIYDYFPDDKKGKRNKITPY